MLKKDETVKMVKEILGLGSKKETEIKLAELDKFIEDVFEKLEVGEAVKLGTFVELSKVHVDAKTARNPKTGAKVDVPEKIVLKVKATKALNKN